MEASVVQEMTAWVSTRPWTIGDLLEVLTRALSEKDVSRDTKLTVDTPPDDEGNCYVLEVEEVRVLRLATEDEPDDTDEGERTVSISTRGT